MGSYVGKPTIALKVVPRLLITFPISSFDYGGLAGLNMGV